MLNHYLKIILLVLSIAPSLVIAQPKTLCETIDIKIDFYAVGSCSPSARISLSKTGLTCTNLRYEAVDNFDSISYSSLYIPFARLDIENFYRINKYVRKNFPKRLNKKELGIYNKEGKKIIRFHILPMKISFLDEYKGKYWSFTYYYCDEKVDKLLWMLNELIPDSKFFIYPRCQ